MLGPLGSDESAGQNCFIREYWHISKTWTEGKQEEHIENG